MCENLLKNEMLKDTVGIACQVAELVFKQSKVALRDIEKLFHVKSLCKQHKSAYHFVIKQLLLKRGLRWTDLPSEIIPESLV